MLQHPSELVRVDEKLRAKILELEKINENSFGWSLQAEREIAEHLRMLVNMRVCLMHAASEYFGACILSTSELVQLQDQSSKYVKTLREEQLPCLEIKSIRSETLWFLCAMATDKNMTEAFYRKLLVEIIPTLKEREDIITHVTKYIDFTTPTYTTDI